MQKTCFGKKIFGANQYFSVFRSDLFEQAGIVQYSSTRVSNLQTRKRANFEIFSSVKPIPNRFQRPPYGYPTKPFRGTCMPMPAGTRHLFAPAGDSLFF